ncbi:MAG: ribbon-helix-helix protein, CopG family [Ilumatobacteraceae bacterium]
MPSQLAIRLPDDLLRDLDWIVVRLKYDSRTEAMRDALVRLVDQERRRDIGEQIAEGYRRMPQTEEEIDGGDQAFLDSVNDEPWDKWW